MKNRESREFLKTKPFSNLFYLFIVSKHLHMYLKKNNRTECSFSPSKKNNGAENLFIEVKVVVDDSRSFGQMKDDDNDNFCFGED